MIRIYLSKLLGEKRITQKDLSEKTGIRPATINEIYHEIIERINLEHLDLICEVLNCKLDDLIQYIPNEIPKTGENLKKEKNKKEN